MIKLIGKVKPYRQCFDWTVDNSKVLDSQNVFAEVAKVFDGKKSYALHTVCDVKSYEVKRSNNLVLEYHDRHLCRIPGTKDIYMAQSFIAFGKCYIVAARINEENKGTYYIFCQSKKNEVVPLEREKYVLPF